MGHGRGCRVVVMGALDKVLTDVQGIVIDSKFESWKGFLEIISPTLLILWERRLIDSQRGKKYLLKVSL